MASARILKPSGLLHGDGYPGTYALMGHPMAYAEAVAYSAYQAGIATEAQLALVKAWVVRITLLHGGEVAEDLGF